MIIIYPPNNSYHESKPLTWRLSLNLDSYVQGASALFSRTALCDLFHCATREDGAIELWVFNVPQRIGMLVAVLDEQPALPLAGTRLALSRLDQAEATAQLLAVE